MLLVEQEVGQVFRMADRNYVLSQGMGRFASQAGYNVDFGSLFAAVVITVVPVLIMYVIFQRQLAGSVTQGTMK